MSDYILKHHGIKGQKWGVRRFQNPDGTMTEAGKKRYKRYGEAINTVRKNRFEKKIEKKLRKNEAEDAKVQREQASDIRKTQSKYKLKEAKSNYSYDKTIANGVRNYGDKFGVKDYRDEKADVAKRIRDKGVKKVGNKKEWAQATKEGQNRYATVIKQYGKMKTKAFEDKAFKKDPAYKKAVRDYTKQKLLDLTQGRSYTKWSYTMDAAIDNLTKK